MEHNVPKNKKAQTISLISGKGGVGKTAVCASLGSLLSSMGYKTLLVDADLATHGLTYFFIDQVQSSNATDLMELAAHDPPEITNAVASAIPARINESLFLVPSISDFADAQSWVTTDNQENIEIPLSTIRMVLDTLIGKYRANVNFIILDAQAGTVPASRACIELSDIVITVLEADPIGMWAVRTLERRFANAYSPRTQSFYLANKLFFEEVAQYKAIIEYLRAFSHLPPLPFDLAVRRAFARRTVPINLDEPSAFLFAILRLAKDLLPTLESKVRTVEEVLYQRAVGPTQKEIEDLNNKIAQTEELVGHAERRKRRSRLLGLAFSIYLTVFVGISIAIIGNIFVPLNLTDVASVAIALSAFLVITLSTYLIVSPEAERFYYEFKRTVLGSKTPEPKELDLLLRELDDLIERRRSLETFIHTRSEELIFDTRASAGLETLAKNQI